MRIISSAFRAGVSMKKILILTMGVIILATTVLVGCQGSISPLEDIKWSLVSYGEPGNVKAVLPDTEPTARFDGETKEVRGSGGCNTYFGTYKVDGNDLAIIEPFAVTEMWCGDEKGAQESEYLDILLAAESFEIEGDTLTIYSGDGVLNYERE
jgi:heat shock protein HslJ